MKIAIIYSLPTRRVKETPYLATDEDTKDSAEEVSEVLQTKGVQTTLVPVSEDAIDLFKTIGADVIFNLIEWDGFDTPLTLKAMGILESLNIPYTGSSIKAIEIVSDKVKMKETLDVNKLPTARWQIFTHGDEPVRPDFHYPIILKLAWEHCSVGLTKDAIVTSPESLTAAVKERIRIFKQPVYGEEFISGREFQVTILEEKKGLRVLPPAEITFTKHGTDAFLTYESRWNDEHPDYDTSSVRKADLTPTLIQKLYRIAHKTYKAFDFHDYARLDIRCRDEDVYILEANANPGLGDDEDYGMTVSYKAAGMTFADFCWEVVESCLRRFNQRTS